MFTETILWTADKIAWGLSQRYAVVCVHAHKNKKFQVEVTPQDGNKIMIFPTYYIALP